MDDSALHGLIQAHPAGMVDETGASSAKFLREAATRKGPDEDARARAERGRAKNAALAARDDVQQLSSDLVQSHTPPLPSLHIQPGQPTM